MSATTFYPGGPTFAQWMRKVDYHTYVHSGMRSSDLDAMPYRRMYDDGASAVEAAWDALDASGAWEFAI